MWKCEAFGVDKEGKKMQDLQQYFKTINKSSSQTSIWRVRLKTKSGRTHFNPLELMVFLGLTFGVTVLCVPCSKL